MKNIHRSPVYADAIAAAVIIPFGLSFCIGLDFAIGIATVGMLLALATLEYTSSRKRLEVK